MRVISLLFCFKIEDATDRGDEKVPREYPRNSDEQKIRLPNSMITSPAMIFSELFLSGTLLAVCLSCFAFGAKRFVAA